MSFFKLVQQRYSCRQYINKPIPRESLERCLEAARLAPSACNSQPWYFIVVDSPQLKAELSQKAFSGLYQMNAFAKEAGAILVVVRDRSKIFARIGGELRGTEYRLLDIGIACEHFILQAAEEGLGTCWIGWFNEREVKKVLNIPWYKKIDVVISVGYPTENNSSEKKRKALTEMSEFRS